MPAPPSSDPSVEESVYLQLRDDLIHLRLTPGERLVLDDLTERYMVSVTPIRHALRRLESDRLVVSERNRGARVAPLTIEDVEEIQAIRLGVTLLLSRWGAESATDEALAEMEQYMRQMAEAVERDQHDAYLSLYQEFRFAFYECAGRPHLMRMLAANQYRMDRYTLAVDLAYRAGSFVDYDWREARNPMRMLEACRNRDGDLAQQLSQEAALHVLGELRRLLGARERTVIRL
jgi:DNA-binding GntR family transcriptional regulator